MPMNSYFSLLVVRSLSGISLDFDFAKGELIARQNLKVGGIARQNLKVGGLSWYDSGLKDTVGK